MYGVGGEEERRKEKSKGQAEAEAEGEQGMLIRCDYMCRYMFA